MKKPLVYFVLVLLVLFSAFTASIIPTANKLAGCYEESTQILRMETERLLNDGEINKKNFCASAEKTTRNLVSCIDKIEENAIVPPSLVYTISKKFNTELVTPQQVIKNHNEACLDYPDFQI